VPYPYRDPLGGGPPGPIIDATFYRGSTERVVAAFVDTGADMTQIPLRLADELGLQRIGDVAIRGANDYEVDADTYVVNLRLGSLEFQYIEVAAPDVDDVLIGRDLLATLLAMFDGPGQQFELTRP